MATTTISATWYSPSLVITDTRLIVTANSVDRVYLTSTTYNINTINNNLLRFTGYKYAHNISNFKVWMTDNKDILTSPVYDIGYNKSILLENKNALVIPQTGNNAFIYNPTTKSISKSVSCSGYCDGIVRQSSSVVLVPKYAQKIKILDSTAKNIIQDLSIQIPSDAIVEYLFDLNTDKYTLTLPTIGGSIISDIKTTNALRMLGGTAETQVLNVLVQDAQTTDYYINNNTISFDIYISASPGTSTAGTTGTDILSIGLDNGNTTTTNSGSNSYGYKFSYFSNLLNYTLYTDSPGVRVGVATYGSTVPTGRWIHYDIVWNNTHTPDIYQDGSVLTKTTTLTGSANLLLKEGIGTKSIRFHGSVIAKPQFANFRMYRRQLTPTERNCLQAFSSISNGYMGYSAGISAYNNIVLVPEKSNTITLISPTNVISFLTPIIGPFISTDISVVNSKYVGGVLLLNSKILFVPNNATKIGLLTLPSTFTEDAVTITNASSLDKYRGGVLLLDGRVVFIPSSATTIGIYNPTVTTPTFVNGPSATGYSGGRLLNDGRVVMFPNTATQIAIYNPFTNNISYMRDATGIADMMYLDDKSYITITNKSTALRIYKPRDLSISETDIFADGPTATGYKTQVRLTNDNIVFMNNTTSTVLTYDSSMNTTVSSTATVSYVNAIPISDGTFLKGPFNNMRRGLYTINGTTPTIKSTYPQLLYTKVFTKAGSSFFLTAQNTLYACGSNNNGQLGIGNYQNALFPKLVDTRILTSLNAGTITQVATGYNVSFILTSSGKVFYTSNSVFIELSLTPFTNVNAGSVTQISTLVTTTLFLTSSGKAFIETNSMGGSISAVNTTNIGENSIITQVSVGGIANSVCHSLLLRNDGKVFSFGANTVGQCGNGTVAISVLIPTEIDTTNIGSTAVITQIAAGYYESFFLTNEGKAFGCGKNGKGQLGTGNNTGLTVPTAIDTTNITNAGVKITKLSEGGVDHFVFLTSENKVYSCGFNSNYQLGISTTATTNVTIPTLVITTNLENENAGTITDVFAGESSTVLFTQSTGKSFACGLNSKLGTLDTLLSGTPDSARIPARTFVSDLDGYSDGILLTNGKVLLVPTTKTSVVRVLDTLTNTTTTPSSNKLSGFSSGITLADGNILLVPRSTSQIAIYNQTTDTLSQVANINTYTSVSNLIHNTLLLRSDGKVFATGLNDTGALGTNNTTTTSTPTMVDTTYIGKNGVITKIIASGATTQFPLGSSYFIRNDGTVFACGYNATGECGVGYTSDSVLIPTPIDTTNIGANSIITQISGCGGALFLRSDGKAFYCGGYGNGRGGTGGPNAAIIIPTQVNTTNIGADGILTQVVCGSDWSYFLRNDGAVFRCGYQLSTIPIKLSFGENIVIKYIVHKVELALFLTTTNRLFRCHRNGSTLTEIDTTAFLSGGHTILKIDGGAGHAIALRSDGRVFAIPLGGYSGFDSGTWPYYPFTEFTEINLSNIGSRPIIDISCGQATSFFIRDDYTIFACGRDKYGELGLKSVNGIVLTPTEVAPPVGYKYATKLTDGRVLLFPDIDGQNICVYNPSKNMISYPPSNIKWSTYSKATLIKNGNIILTPDTATTIGIYTPLKTLRTKTDTNINVSGKLQSTNYNILGNSNTTLTTVNSTKFIKWITSITKVRYGSWWNSTSSLNFTETTFTGTQLNGTDTTNNKYTGGILLSDGNVLFITRASGRFGIYNPTYNTFTETTNGVVSSVSDKYVSGVLLPDGRVIFVPCNSNRIGIYNPVSGVFTETSHASTTLASGSATSGFKYAGGVLLPDGRVVFVPYNSNRIGIYNPVSAVFTETSHEGTTLASASTNGGLKYIGGVLLSDGRVVFAPSNSNRIGIYNPVSGVFTETSYEGTTLASAAASSGDKYGGGVLLADGRVVFVPSNSNKLGIYDPFSDVFTEKSYSGTTLAPGAATGGNKYASGVLLSDGRVVFVPYSSNKLGIYNPVSDVFTETSHEGTTLAVGSAATGNKYNGGLLLPDGRVVFIPYVSNKVGILSGLPSVPIERCLHPCFNKF